MARVLLILILIGLCLPAHAMEYSSKYITQRVRVPVITLFTEALGGFARVLPNVKTKSSLNKIEPHDPTRAGTE